MTASGPAPATLLNRHASRVVGVIIIITLATLTRLPRLDDDAHAALAGRYRFVPITLPEVPGGPTPRTLRDVNPSVRSIDGWISTVGAAVAMNDLDGDGLPNDLVLVDPRTDRVLVMPVPGTGDRFPPFALPMPVSSPDPETVAPTGCVPTDANEDGLVDLVIYFWGRPPVAYLRRNGTSIEPNAFAAIDLAPAEQRWYTNAATCADLDGDGHVDLVIGNYFADDCRLLDPTSDEPVSMHDSMSRAFNGGHDRILRWTGATSGGAPSVSYEHVADAFVAPIGRGWTLAIAAADLDGDLLPELYFANDFGPDRLLRNDSEPGHLRFALLEGERTWTAPASKTLGHDSFKGMGADFADVNGDGLMDLFVSNIAQEFALEESHFLFVSTGDVAAIADGIAPYVDRSEPLGVSRSGWGWGVKLADLDNDGVLEALQATGFLAGEHNRWPELHETAMGNDDLLRHPSSWHHLTAGDDLSGHQHNPLFARAPTGRFFDVAPEVGLGAQHVTRGIALADVDGDGDLDCAFANQWEASHFARNDCPDPGAFLGLNILFPVGGTTVSTPTAHAGLAAAAGRAAIGVTARIRTVDGHTHVAQVDGGNGHSGIRAPHLHFGLGAASPDDVIQVELAWRDATGEARAAQLDLTPGWHTVMLPAPTQPANDRETTG